MQTQHACDTSQVRRSCNSQLANVLWENLSQGDPWMIAVNNCCQYICSVVIAELLAGQAQDMLIVQVKGNCSEEYEAL